MLNPQDAASAAPPPPVQTPAATAEFSLAAYRAEQQVASTEPEVAPPAATDPVVDPEVESDAEEPGTADETTEQDQDGKPKKQGGFQKRISKLTSDRDALIAERDQLKAQLAGSTAAKPNEPTPTPAAAAPAPNAAPQFVDAEPQLEDFETIAEYTKALLKWDRSKASFEVQQQEAQRRQADATKAVVDTWNQKATETKARHTDYDAALASVKDIAIPPAMQHALLESEYGPEIAYHLAKHPEELQRIATLTPLAAARAIGKIEAALDVDAPQTATRVSNAPRPIRPVGGRAVVTTPNLNREMSLAEYRAERERAA